MTGVKTIIVRSPPPVIVDYLRGGTHVYENEYSFGAHFYFTDEVVSFVSTVTPYL
jgi:hypothetical protein